MSKVYIISDTHFGHKNITKYRPQFSTSQEHDDTLLQNIKDTVKRRDILIMLGDIAFTEEALLKLKEVNCRKHIVLGNHDMQFSRDKSHLLYEVFDRVDALRSYKGCWLTHCPIHPEELRGKFNISGHVHYKSIDDPRYFNACVENTNFYPKLFVKIYEQLQAANREYDA